LSAPLGFLERSAEGGFGFGIAARSGSAALFVSILINATICLLALGILSKIKGFI
jgi:hypothetical protein